MRRSVVFAAWLAAFSALSACQRNPTIAVQQTQTGSLASVGESGAMLPALKPGETTCLQPWGSGPFTQAGKPISTRIVPTPARALAKHVTGCGGVRFRIGPDGTPQDVEILADYPVGYGFGDTVRQMIVTSRWTPRDDMSWHYLNATIGVPRTQ